MKPGKNDFPRVLEGIKEIMKLEGSRDTKLVEICTLLKQRITHYDWVGFYFADEKNRQLILGPYIGEPTEHTRIQFGSGICGQAAERRETFIVQDVSTEANYLACSPLVMSEIVVPIFKNNRVVGELDIDSHMKHPFTSEDKEFLERVSELVAGLF
jgi:GAF domain-containing protein